MRTDCSTSHAQEVSANVEVSKATKMTEEFTSLRVIRGPRSQV